MRPFTRTLALAFTWLLSLGLASSSDALTLTFSGLEHGLIVSNVDGVDITVENPVGPDIAAIFDGLVNGTADPDLEGPLWDLGNLAPDTVLGQMLIIAENDQDLGGDGILDDPDDEGFGGRITFDDLPSGLTAFGFDLVDVEIETELGSVEFYEGEVLVGTVGFEDFVNPGSTFYDPTVEFGDNSANRIEPIRMSQLGGTTYDRVEVFFEGSSAIDNLQFIPEPMTGALLGAGLLGLGMIGRRRTGA